MNLTISKEHLLNGLQAVQNVVGSRTTLPILSNVLVRAEGNKLEFTATDLDVTVTCSVEATIKKGGSTTIPVKKLFGITRELAGGEIDLEVDEKNVCSVLELVNRRKFFSRQTMDFVERRTRTDATDIFLVHFQINFTASQLTCNAKQLFYRNGR